MVSPVMPDTRTAHKKKGRSLAAPPPLSCYVAKPQAFSRLREVRQPCA